MDLNYLQFQQVDLGDDFFTSLKQDYSEFEEWFQRKASNRAYIHRTPEGNLDGFLYLKREEEALSDVVPPLPAKNRLKVGTFKIDAHGTKLGERFIKKVFDHAIHEASEEIYVTVFEKHAPLVALFERYGFRRVGSKTTQNGTELVLLRPMSWTATGLDENYPLVSTDSRQFLLSLRPEWHTRLLPDSILVNEDSDIIQDVSHTNSIHKVYLTAMRGVDALQRGDVLLIYRTSDQTGAAYYRSVASSICVVEEFRHINSFDSEADFLAYCSPYSVFTPEELRKFYSSRRFPFILRFTYNIALRRRPNRKILIEEIGLNPDQYWGFFQLSKEQFRAIVTKGEVNESLIVD